jgi:hypothetical protein
MTMRSSGLLAFCALLAFAIAGCGGGGSGRLTQAAYKNRLAEISSQVNASHASLGQAAAQATTIAQVQAALRRYAAREQRTSDEVAKLKPPANAEAANAELARGEHDDSAEILALLPKLVKFKTVREAFSYLQTVSHAGGHEQDAALKKLKKLGYTSGS